MSAEPTLNLRFRPRGDGQSLWFQRSLCICRRHWWLFPPTVADASTSATAVSLLTDHDRAFCKRCRVPHMGGPSPGEAEARGTQRATATRPPAAAPLIPPIPPELPCLIRYRFLGPSGLATIDARPAGNPGGLGTRTFLGFFASLLPCFVLFMVVSFWWRGARRSGTSRASRADHALCCRPSPAR
jgi:hypothetical protein